MGKHRSGIASLLGMMRPSSRKSSREGRKYEELEPILKEYWEVVVRHSPEMATMCGDHRYDRLLTENTIEAKQAHLKVLQHFARRVEELFPKEEEEFRRASWTLDQRVNLMILKDDIAREINFIELGFHLMPVNSQDSLVSLSMVVEKMKFETKRDYETYQARVAALPQFIQNEIKLLRIGLKRGITPPSVAVESVPSQLEDFIAGDETCPLFEPLEPTKLAQAKITDKLANSIRNTIQSQVFPAFQRYADFLRDEYIPALPQELVMERRIPNGEKHYSFLLKLHTTTSLDALAVHDLGVAEVERISRKMQEIAEKEGFASPVEYKAFLDDTCTCSTEEELLSYYRNVAMKIGAKLPKLFGKLPRVTFGIKPVPTFIAPDEAAGYYIEPPVDFSEPGWFFLNTSMLETRKTYTAEALTLHEAWPGHHFQIALGLEKTDLPDVRKFADYYNAFVEGWGLYAEFLGEELGVYETPASMFGRLVEEQVRACRLVVDTGMNALGWSMDRAVSFMLENHAGTEEEIATECIRYVSIPGQACAYKLGELKLRELRELAHQRLGEKFSVRAFHDLVLDIGPGGCPISALEEVVLQWIESQLSK